MTLYYIYHSYNTLLKNLIILISSGGLTFIITENINLKEILFFLEAIVVIG